MEIVPTAVGKALDFVVELVCRQSGYLFFYKGNVEELRQCAKKLRDARDNMQHRVDEDIRNGKEIETGVKNCLEEVNDFIAKTEEFQKDEGHTKTGCSNGLFPNNLRLRHRLGRRAKKMADNVDRLLKDLDVPSVSYWPEPTSMDAALSNIGYQSFESRNENMEMIMAVLEDLTVRKIGIYGPGGVGKTTLVKEVAKKACDNKLFDVVVIVSVKRNPDPKQIQGEIAYMLGLRLEEESEIGRADRLRQRLKREKNTLVILDDLWEGLDLNRLGIPFDDEDDFNQMTNEDIPDFDYDMVKQEKATGEYKGCKILITSRIVGVLSTQMGVKKNSIFRVRDLQQNEAVELLKKVAGVQGKSPEFEQLSTEIVNVCGRLPMEIVIIARALANKDCSEWKDALRQLQRKEHMGVKKPMEFSIKLSYDHLESEELKSFFLICARMGSHALIVDLMKYCIGLGIFQGVHTIREARNRIYTLIRKLKDSCLLLDSDSHDHLNMHDMVRDVALSIASKEKNVFIVRNGKIDEWPDKDELEKCTAISIHNSDIIDELPKSIKCPQLEVFHIDSDDPSMGIPDNFFDGMDNLRILILTGIHLPSLPSSIKCLMNLKMLCLEQCKLGGNLSIIGELKKLRILSFSGSEIENLPNELGKLGKLQLFDISNCSKLKGIPPNFISSLNSLEELYMRDSLVQWEIEGQTNQSQNSVLDELAHMHQLMTLDICIPNAELLPTNLFFDKLDNYKIVIGDFNMLSVGDFKMPHKYEASRTLALQLKEATDIHSQKGIKMLFKGVENLLLEELNGVQNIFDELNLDGFPYLKHLSIVNNFEIKYIINSIEFLCPQSAFPKLESLCLYKLEKLEKICSTKPMNDSFGNLKSIKINVCGQLKNLFSFYMVRLFTKLETIEVSECDSLEEIVVGERDENNENNVEVNDIEFPELRSLTLRSLPKFTGFYTNGRKLSESQSIERQLSNSDCDEITTVDEHRPTASLSLFSEQVAIPNLESLELSAINIHEIWREQPLPPFCFQKLIKLNVKDCNSMRYLFTLSMAKSLSNLKGLFVSGCKVMEEIYTCEDSIKDEVKVSMIFPKLEEIQFSSMESLGKIWPSQVSSDSFGSLASVVIEKCEKLKTVFPGHMVGRFQKLISLKVFDCKSVEKIFDLEKISPQTQSGHETYLQFFFIKELPKLEHIWNKDPEGILSFKNLQKLEVYGCHNLKNLLPVSVAKDLDKLQYLTVLYCNGMEEIVSLEEGSNSKTSSEALFPQVSFLQFQRLLKLKSLCGGRHILDWPQLKRLSVCYCETPEAQPIFLEEKVICSLEMLTLTLNLKNLLWLQNCVGKYGMHSLKDLRLASLQSAEILYGLLRRIPKLEDLTLYSCSFEEVFPEGSLTAQEKIGTVVQLKGLVLSDMAALLNIGFERDPVFQRIERLRLHCCPRLVNIVPVSVSFTYLTHLEVSECDEIKNLMAFSTAKGLVQLTTMKVIKCKRMEEIVGKEGNEEEREDKIIFSKLMTLELASLENLKSFCSSKNCASEFPSLEKMIVRECPIMKVFSEGVTSTPKLRQVRIVEEDEERWHWNGDLNATIKNLFTDMFASGVEHLELSDHPILKEIWNGEVPVPDRWFSNLKSLIIKGCEFLSNVIPSNLLPFLSKLEKLEVQDCNSVKVIYDVKDITEERKMKNMGTALPLPFPLKKLILKELPNLEHVWNSDPQGIVGLQHLQEVHVERCKCLRSLFPESVVKDLVNLENVVVRYCEEMVEIIAKDDEEAAQEATKEFVFPRVTSLTLCELPKLKWFYPGLHELKCPELKNLDVHHCIMLEILTSEFESYRTARPDDHAFLTLVAKVASNLEKLSLNKEHTMMIWHGQFQANLLQKLKSIVLQCFHYKSDIFPCGFLQKVPHIEEVEVRCCHFKNIFSMDRPDMNYTGVLSQLKRLRLKFLPELNSIGLEHSWVDSIPENLETLEVYRCHSLENLAPSTVFFSNLTDLTVSECHQLQYLLTSSTAKSMCLLEKISIRQCESLEEIVATEGAELNQDEIVFGELKTLYLDSLQSLSNFYTGSYTLQFPSFEKVTVLGCPKMKNFCQNVNAPKLSGVKFQGHIGELKLFGDEFQEHTDRDRWEGDLNTTIRKAFEETIKEVPCDVQHLELSKHPELEVIWNSVDSVPETYFSNLKSLVVEGFEYLSPIIPSHVLSLLSNLEELEVRNCNSANVIFDVRDIRGDRRMKHMKSVTKYIEKLEILDVTYCEGLVEIVGKDEATTKGAKKVCVLSAISFSNLKELRLAECHGLIYLFTSSTARSLAQLKMIFIEKCESMKEIVANEVNDTTEDEITFGQLKLLSLNSLSSLATFYEGNSTLNFPFLVEAIITQCPKMKIFSQGLLRAPMLEVVETSPGNWDMCSEGNLNLTIKKLLERKIKEFPCDVQHLELSKHPELEVIWNGVNSVPETYFSNLISLLVEGCEYLSTIIPSSVLSLLSNLEELEVRNCNSANVIFDERDIRGDRRMTHMKSVTKYLEKLEKLDVKYCEGLVEIVGKDEAATEGAKKECVLSAVSFSNLKELRLAECHGLIYLFTSSTARSLAQLKLIFIEKCESMKEIVAKEVNDTTEDEITFGQLKLLSLNSLSSLATFYEGNSTLNFPFLVEAIITQCPKMKIFSQGLIRAPMLEVVETSPGCWDMCSEGNLNLTIKKLLERKDAKIACDVHLLKLCDHPELIEIFCGVVPVPNRLYFINLKLLVVVGCEFLSHVIPFNVLTFLHNLEELKVGNCDSVKVIFDFGFINEEREKIDMTPASSHSFPPIKKLTLENLPNLEHVWNVINRQGIFNLPVLQKLHVDECKSLKSLFPATMAKGLVKLEELQVQYCEGLVEIVAKNEATTEGAIEDFVFPRLMSVILCELPELKNFYPGLHKLKCPMLKELDMYRCYMKFTYESQNFHVIHKLFSWFRKVNLPNLNQLSPKNQTLR